MPRVIPERHVSNRTQLMLALSNSVAPAPDLEPQISYYPSMMCWTALPARSQPGRSEYVHQVGNATLSVLTPSHIGLPFGTYARGVINHISTEVTRRKNQQQDDPQVVVLGDSLTDAVRHLTGKTFDQGGKTSPRELLRRQVISLAASTINYNEVKPGDQYPTGGNIQIGSNYAPTNLWGPQLVGSKRVNSQEFLIRIGDAYYADILERSVPISPLVMRSLWGDVLAMDIYVWITYRANHCQHHGGFFNLSWHNIREQFGSGYSAGSIRSFRSKFWKAWQRVRQSYDVNDPDCIRMNEVEDRFGNRVGDRLLFQVKRPSVRSVVNGTPLQLGNDAPAPPNPGSVVIMRRPPADQIDLL